MVSGNNSKDLIFSEKEKVDSCSKIERTETGAETDVGSKVDKTIESESKARNNDTDDDVIVLGKYQNERKSSTRTPGNSYRKISLIRKHPIVYKTLLLMQFSCFDPSIVCCPILKKSFLWNPLFINALRVE